MVITVCGVSGAVGAMRAEPAAAGGSTELLPRVVVRGYNTATPASLPLGVSYDEPGPADRARVQDAAGLFEGTAGVGVVRNGSQTGMPQVRGPHADGDSPAPRFGTNKIFQPFGEFTTGLSSLNNGWSGGTVAGLANRDYSVDYRGSIQRAGDYYFPGGRVRASGYDVMHHALRGAADTRHGLIRAEAGWSQTRDAGTPALPMDMIENDGWNVAAGFEGTVISVARIESRAYFHHTDHLMDNYSLRPAGPRRMLSPARSDALGFRTGLALPRGGETYRLGLDYHGNRFDAYQQNADSGARQNTINNGSRDRLGGYAEWQSDWSSRWTTLLGVRSDAVWSEANPIEDYFPPARPDAERFNQQTRALSDLNLDATAAVRFTANERSTYEVGVARKDRAPSLLERYLWTPLSASAGQADGRTYLGDLHLEPETAWQFSLTGDWHGPRWQVRVSPFYSLVYDYIQGMPIARRDEAGRAVLQYTNLERADLYGGELTAEWRFTGAFTLGGILSYVRGINRDNDDNLYRIAPLRGAVTLDWEHGRWTAGTRVVLVADQDEVAAYNGETTTPGYVLWNLRAGYQFTRWLSLDAGVDNLLDTFYTDHLDGVNRVAGSDVAVGQRLPGAGRFVYGALRITWE